MHDPSTIRFKCALFSGASSTRAKLVKCSAVKCKNIFCWKCYRQRHKWKFGMETSHFDYGIKSSDSIFALSSSLTFAFSSLMQKKYSTDANDMNDMNGERWFPDAFRFRLGLWFKLDESTKWLASNSGRTKDNNLSGIHAIKCSRMWLKKKRVLKICVGASHRLT